MHADDIVLLSKSAEGMQEKLDKLSAFSNNLSLIPVCITLSNAF
jgi:hypothetical protein